MLSLWVIECPRSVVLPVVVLHLRSVLLVVVVAEVAFLLVELVVEEVLLHTLRNVVPLGTNSVAVQVDIDILVARYINISVAHSKAA